MWRAAGSVIGRSGVGSSDVGSISGGVGGTTTLDTTATNHATPRAPYHPSLVCLRHVNEFMVEVTRRSGVEDQGQQRSGWGGRRALCKMRREDPSYLRSRWLFSCIIYIHFFGHTLTPPPFGETSP